MIVARVDVCRNLYVLAGRERLLSVGNVEILVKLPRILLLLNGVHAASRCRRAMRVVVEVVVNFDVVLAKLVVVGKYVAERNRLAAVIHLAVDRVGCDALLRYLWIGHILLIVVRTAARTKCAQQ